MNQHWRQSTTASQQNGNGSNEINLSAFAGICFKCHKKGYTVKAKQGRNRKQGQNRGQGRWKVLRKVEQSLQSWLQAHECWEKEENKSNWFKVAKE